MVYRHKISDTDQLKQVLIDSWAQLSQDTLNQAIDQLPKRLALVIKTKGGHDEFRTISSICVRDRPCLTVFRVKIEQN